METQFITNAKGDKINAIISIAAYKHFIELLEQEDDCNRFDKALEEPDEKTYTAKEIADDIGYAL